MSKQNVYESIDASTLATAGSIVPVDVPGNEAFSLDRATAEEWSVKVVNDSDQSIDATPVITTGDDSAFAEYDTVGTATTVSTGTPPDNVELIGGSDIGGYLGVELAPANAATGTVTIVFESGG